MSAVYFTSDLHLGHQLVAGLRGFDVADDHDAAIVDAWRRTVRKGDQVWVLGDVAVSSPAYALGVLAALPGEKHLIVGNHDACHPMHRDAHRKQRQYLDVFASVQTAARRRVAGQSVLLSHMPYRADRDETRFTQWRLPDEGVPLLHGHTHSPRKFTGLRELHVGLDAWGMTPVPLRDVEAWVSEVHAIRDVRVAIEKELGA